MIKSVRSLPKGGCSRLDHFIMRFALPLALHFLERAFGKMRILREWRSLCGCSITKDFNFR
jgi:hypothetical protein